MTPTRSPRMEAESVFAAMEMLGEAWRGDWSDFDGRTLRSQLDQLARLGREALAGTAIVGPLAGFYAEQNICPYCRSWTEYCDGHS